MIFWVLCQAYSALENFQLLPPSHRTNDFVFEKIHREKSKVKLYSMRYAEPWICWKRIISAFVLWMMLNRG